MTQPPCPPLPARVPRGRRPFLLVLAPALLGPFLGEPSARAQAVDGAEAMLSAWAPEDRRLRAVGLEDLGARDPGGPGPCALHSTRLVARDAVDQLRADRAQSVELDGGLLGARRPDGQMLLRYSRHGVARAGVLSVDPDGRVRVLDERALAQGRTPFTPWIAVSDWDPVAAVVLDQDRTGRGDVVLLRLDGGTFPRSGRSSLLVTGGLAAPDAEPFSLTFCRGALFFTDNDLQLYRVPTDGSTDAVQVALPDSDGKVPATISEEIQVSADGGTLALLAGESETRWDLYVGDALGAFRNLSGAADEYQPVDHLTSSPTGPGLALSADGREIVYGCECPDLELFHRATDGSGAIVQLTGDAQFEQSFDDGSGIALLALGVILFAFGERFDAKDVFQLEVGGGQVLGATNLTLTSGDPLAPFQTGGGITPGMLATTPGGGAALVDDRSADLGRASFDLWRLDGTAARLDVSDLIVPPSLATLPPGTMDGVLVGFEDAQGSGIAVQPRSTSAPWRLLLRAPAGVDLHGLSAAPSGVRAACYASAGPGFAVPVSLDLGTGAARLLQPRPGTVGRRIGWTADGRCCWTWGSNADRLVQIEDRPRGGGVISLDLGAGELVLLR